MVAGPCSEEGCAGPSHNGSYAELDDSAHALLIHITPTMTIRFSPTGNCHKFPTFDCQLARRQRNLGLGVQRPREMGPELPETEMNQTLPVDVHFPVSKEMGVLFGVKTLRVYAVSLLRVTG